MGEERHLHLVIRRPDLLRGPPRLVTVPRPGGGVRLLTELDPLDARTFRRSVERVAPAVERRLGPGVVANRLAGPDLRLEDWRVARRRWARATTAAPRGLRLHLDVAGCYGGIRPELVADALRRAGVTDTEELLRFLREVNAAGVPGLPVGPHASAVLANAVLARLDDAVAATGAAHVRWVDDLVVEVPSRRRAIAVLDAARRELGAMGLELQPAKTRLTAGRIRARPPSPGR